MHPPTPTDKENEPKDERLWWTYPPYYNTFEPSVDGGSHDLPAIVAEAQARSRKSTILACIEIVDRTRHTSSFKDEQATCMHLISRFTALLEDEK